MVVSYGSRYLFFCFVQFFLAIGIIAMWVVFYYSKPVGSSVFLDMRKYGCSMEVYRDGVLRVMLF